MTFWYQKNIWTYLLSPISYLFRLIVFLRRLAYKAGLKKSCYFPVPVIVIGNISVGGTGKTPLTIWLANFLSQKGFNPGIVSRGYKGKLKSFPEWVQPDSDAREYGDEPVIIAKQTGCPVIIDPDRVRGTHFLLMNTVSDIVLCDDGLQHYALGRDIEIAVVDGERGFGNGFCLPAGPLREPISRLNNIDLVVSKKNSFNHYYKMTYQFKHLCSLKDDTHLMAILSLRGKQCHAVAGIGNPDSFFTMLKSLGLSVIEHPYPDHYDYKKDDIEFDDNLIVIMTEKDAVKCRSFASNKHWYLPIKAELSHEFATHILDNLNNIKRD